MQALYSFLIILKGRGYIRLLYFYMADNRLNRSNYIATFFKYVNKISISFFGILLIERMQNILGKRIQAC